MQNQQMILEDGTSLLLIHFLYRAASGQVGEDGTTLADAKWLVACTPGMVDLSAQGVGRSFPWMRTEEPRGVTCPNCKATEEYQSAMANVEQWLGRRR